MTTRVSHIRIYPTDWRSGCMGLSLEQEGLYIRMCMFMAETGRRVPLDDTEAARMMNVQTRNYRRVLGELLRIGKITRHDNGYGNDRLEHERAEAEKATGGKPSATSNGSANRQADQGSERQDLETTADLTPIYSGYNAVITEVAGEISQQNQYPSIEPLKEPINTPLPPKGGDFGWLPQGWKITDGRLSISGGERIELLKDFGGDEQILDLAIKAAFEQHNPQGRMPLTATVRRFLTNKALAARQQDARYTKAVKANAKNRKPAFGEDGHEHKISSETKKFVRPAGYDYPEAGRGA